MHKNCGNCGKRQTCAYRGIINPCDEWRADAEIRQLRTMARQCKSKPMSRYDVQFVDAMTNREAYTDNMKIRLRQIHSRVV